MKNLPLYEVRDVKNIKQLVEDSCKLYKDNIAYYVKRGTKDYTTIKYSELLEDMNAFGTALINLGLKDKRIAVIGETRYEWKLTYLSVVNGTGIIVPLDRQLPTSEIVRCLNRAKVDAVVYSEKLQDKIEEIFSGESTTVKYFIGMDIKEDNGNFLSFEKLLEKGKELVKNGDKSFIDAKIDETVMTEILFTSGTTSQSKAAMLSHKSICYDLHQVCQMVKFYPGQDIFLSMLPIHHVFETVAGFLLPLYMGLAVADCEGLRHIQKNMQESHATVMMTVPLVLETLYRKIWEGIDKQGKTKLVKSMIKITNFLDKIGIHLKRKVFKSIHDQFGGNIRLFIAGAAALDPKVSKGFRDLGILAFQGYGLTETSPVVAVSRDVWINDAAAGLPLVGTELKIVDINEDGIGEIVTKGDHVMLGYYEDEEATKEAITDGWFHTGDLGYQDKDGFVFITGRKKNVLITKNGKNIYPEEIEALINDSPYILESMVYLRPEKDDLLLCAEIRVNKEYIEEKFKDAPKTDEEIKQLVWEEVKRIQEPLVIYKHIKEIHIREKEFEKTTTMKIKRYLEKKQ